MNMKTLHSVILTLACFLIAGRAEALTVDYSTILEIKNTTVLIQKHGIETKSNYICSLTTLGCSATKKYTLGAPAILAKQYQDIKDTITENNFNHTTFSSNKMYVAYYQPRREDTGTRTLYLKNTKNDSIFTRSEPVAYWDLLNDQAKIFEFSPDEKELWYLDDSDGFFSLYRAKINELPAGILVGEKITTNLLTIDDFIVYDSQTVFFTGNTKEHPYEWTLYRYNLKTKKQEVAARHISYADRLIRSGSSILYTGITSGGSHAFLYNVKTKKARAFKTPGSTTNTALKNREVISFGGYYGILMKPAQFDVAKIYPLLIWLHGGPYRQSGIEYSSLHSYGLYDSILNLMPKNNVMVLKLDYPGSLGFGRTYSESIKGEVGRGDVGNVMDALLQIKNTYHLQSVYIAGPSYGGYLALKSIVEHPDAFQGAISINGVTDWESLLNDLKTSIFNTHFGGAPNETNKALYDQASILNKTTNLGNQKILITQGDSDKTVPPWQATLLYDKLRTENKNVTFIPYPREDHVFYYKKNVADLCTRMFTFLGKKPDKECTK